MGKAFPDVRDAGQKNRLALMTCISPVNVFVPVIRLRAVLELTRLCARQSLVKEDAM